MRADKIIPPVCRCHLVGIYLIYRLAAVLIAVLERLFVQSVVADVNDDDGNRTCISIVIPFIYNDDDE